jgi:short-subunit dehydrogenase
MVIVSGASRGIGFQIAEKIAKNHKVYGFARSDITQPINFNYTKIDAKTFNRTKLNIAKDEPISKLFLCHAVFGPVKSDIFNLTGNQLENSFKINCISHMVIIKQLLKNLKLSKSPKVIILASKGGIHSHIKGSPSIAYRASKSAQIALGLSMKESLAKIGVDLFLVNPGWVKTKIGGKNATLLARESAEMIINLTKNLDASEHSKPCIHNFDGSITAL